MKSIMTPAERISKARVQLLLNYSPFWGTLALKLRVEQSTVFDTFSVDGTTLFYNADFLSTLSDKELITIIAHEVMHCALRHMYRIEGRDIEVWNEACDQVVNALLHKSNFEFPKDIVIDSKYASMSAEEVYNIFMKERQQNKQKQQQQQQQSGGSGAGGAQSQDDEDDEDDSDSDSDQQDGDGDGDDEQENDNQQNQQQKQQQKQNSKQQGQKPSGAPQPKQAPQNKPKGNSPSTGSFTPPPPPAPDSISAGEEAKSPPLTEKDWEIAAKQAATLAKQAGNVPAGMDIGLEQADEARSEDLNTCLRRFMEKLIPKDWSWATPNRRLMHSGIIFPGVIKENSPNLVIGYDTSGSIAYDEKANKVLSRLITDLVKEFKPEKVTVIYCDTEVAGTQEFGYEDDINLKPKGGGGTAFKPVFDWIEKNCDQKPTAMIYLTDLEAWDIGKLEAPEYPVMWVTMDDSKLEGPFGETCRVNHWMLSEDDD